MQEADREDDITPAPCKKPKVSAATTSGDGNENTSVGQNSAHNRDSIGSRGGKRTATEGIQYNENVVAPALRASKCKAIEV